MSIICPNWLIGYTLVPVMYYQIMPKNGKEVANAEFLNLLGQIDSEIHLTYYFARSQKELRHVSLLRIIQSRNKMQSSTLASEVTIFYCSN